MELDGDEKEVTQDISGSSLNSGQEGDESDTLLTAETSTDGLLPEFFINETFFLSQNTSVEPVGHETSSNNSLMMDEEKIGAKTVNATSSDASTFEEKLIPHSELTPFNLSITSEEGETPAENPCFSRPYSYDCFFTDTRALMMLTVQMVVAVFAVIGCVFKCVDCWLAILFYKHDKQKYARAKKEERRQSDIVRSRRRQFNVFHICSQACGESCSRERYDHSRNVRMELRSINSFHQTSAPVDSQF